MNKVLLIDVDSKIPNLALMKLSAWHKAQRDHVDFTDSNLAYWGDHTKALDIVYASSVFTRSQKERATIAVIYPDAITGGTGYDLTTELPQEVEMSTPDYSIYRTDTSMGFTTRGCKRRCPFCVVPEKEGGITIWQDWREFHDIQHNKIMLLDNNILAASREWWKEQLSSLADSVLEVKENGFDCRLIDEEAAHYISRVKWHQKRIHLAFDHPRQEALVRRSVKLLTDAGLKAYRQMFYVLVGYDTTPEEDHDRVRILEELGADRFIMPHENASADRREFARFINGAHGKIANWPDWVSGRKGKVGFLL